ncbi:hypothetical protein I6I89_06575 [Myroides odoratus]|nr:hypothetical protein I6I89_06575 [Myroides odoratus]
MVEQSTNNLLENVYKFNAKELDAQTGYYYYGARYYDPGASIFLSVDPLAEKYPGINPYVYVANNPVNFVDPDGRKIVNADRLRLAKHRNNYNDYQQRGDFKTYANLSRSEVRRQYGSEGVSKWKSVKSIVKAYETNISKYESRANKTDEIMKKWKKESPNLYGKIDAMNVDMYLGVDQNVSSGLEGKPFGATGGVINEGGENVFRVNDLNATNALPVYINSGVNIDSIDPETGEYSLNHEGGHFIFTVENPTQYLQEKENIGAGNYNGGHHPDATTGKKAKEYGKQKDI